ncbi:PDZ domain-containing protein [Sideroxydans sp.]
MRTFLYMMSVAALLSVNVAAAEETAADARKHMVRGVAAIEMAKSNSELELAANEFGRATELDPVLSSAWFNLGSVQSKLGKYEEAIKSYRRYLELVPNAEDAMKVEDEIIKLEFRQEQVAKVTSMVGTWLAPDNTPYRLDVKGNRLTLATDHHPVTENEVLSTYTLVGAVPVGGNEQVAFRLERVGSNLSGTWWHSAIKADKCKVPEETGEVAGEISADNGTIVLRYTRNKYRASTQMSLLTDDFCSDVSVAEKRKVELVLKGPLPVASITGLSFVSGSFDRVPSLQVYSVEENSTAAAAGLKEGDQVVAIDGVAVQEIAAPGIWFRLRGEVGSDVVLSVQREGEKQLLELRAKRLAFPDYRPKAAD